MTGSPWPGGMSLSGAGRVRGRRLVAAVLCAVGFAVAASSAPALGSPPGYAATELNIRPLGICCVSLAAVNDDSPVQIAESVPTEAGERAEIWQDGSYSDLGLLPTPGGYEPGSYSYATDINDAGVVVGYAQLANTGYNTERAFIWQNGVMTNLGNPAPVYGECSDAYGVNASDTVVGSSSAEGLCDPFPAEWPAGAGESRLPSLKCGGGSCHGQAVAINAGGEIAGWSQNAEGGTDAIVWSGGMLTSLGTLSGKPQDATQATAINDAGVVVGWGNASGTNTPHAFIWENGAMTDLQPLIAAAIAGGNTVVSSEAVRIDSSGDVVGYWTDQNGGQHAFLYSGRTMYDLTSLLEAGSTWGLFTAVGINDAGNVIGEGKAEASNINLGVTNYLLTPAVPPEFGHCVKAASSKEAGTTVYHGWFTNSTCTAKGTSKTNKYEWIAGASGASYKATIKPATKAVLETSARAKVTCTGEEAKGSITGVKSVGQAEITLTGCASATGPCTTLGKTEGVLESNPLEGLIGIERKKIISGKETRYAALDLYPVGRKGPFLEYACAGGGTTTLTGSLIGPVPTDKSFTSATVKYAASHGIQKPERFEGGAADTLNNGHEAVGLTVTSDQTNAQAFEINAFF